MKLKPPNSWDKCCGIFVWGCVERGEGSAFRKFAHAHNYKSDPLFGWICFRSTKRIDGHYRLYSKPKDGFDGEIISTNQILLHEYSHLLAPNHSHDDAWRKAAKSIGCHIQLRYKKKVRSK